MQLHTQDRTQPALSTDMCVEIMRFFKCENFIYFRFDLANKSFFFQILKSGGSCQLSSSTEVKATVPGGINTMKTHCIYVGFS